MLIKNGFLIDPWTKTEKMTDIRLENGVITELGTLAANPQEEVLDISGLIIAPGLIDTHVHFRDPGLTYKEDLHTGAQAAAKGGFTSVICMANTSPVVDNVETLTDILNRAKRESIHIYQAAAVTKGLHGEILNDMEALAEAGAYGFTDDGIPLMNQQLCYEAMKRADSLNLPISFHEEDPSFIENSGINKGAVSEKLGIGGAPAIAEDTLVARDCMLALHTKAHTVIQHISSKNSVAIIRAVKALGANLHAEATPQHFTLTEEAVLEKGTLAKLNPPFRREEDRLAIIEGLKDGTIDLIATDHAPHSEEEKARPLTKAPSGIIGLETSLSLGITSLVMPGYLTLMELLEKMTVNPARLYHLPSGKVTVGAPADFVIFNPDEEWTVETFASKSCNSPFIGRKLFGKIYYTICSGITVYSNTFPFE